jgi:hypothetical protein
MPTYKQIMAYVKNKYGYTPIKNPYPAKKFNHIKEAFDRLKN